MLKFFVPILFLADGNIEIHHAFPEFLVFESLPY